MTQLQTLKTKRQKLFSGSSLYRFCIIYYYANNKLIINLTPLNIRAGNSGALLVADDSYCCITELKISSTWFTN